MNTICVNVLHFCIPELTFYSVLEKLNIDETPQYHCNVQVKEQGHVVYNKSIRFSKEKVALIWV